MGIVTYALAKKYKGAASLIGLGVGAAVGVPGLGYTLGSAVDSLIWQEKKRKIEAPEEKNVLAAATTTISSNVVLPLGFGTFFSAGNILEFLVEREYSFLTTPAMPHSDPIINIRTYFFAVGVSVNPADPISMKIGGMGFQNSEIVSLEVYPEGGKSRYPDFAHSDYRFYQVAGAAEGTVNSLDSGWVYCFAENTSVIVIWISGITLAQLDAHYDFYVHRKVDGKEESKRIEIDEWEDRGGNFWRYHENDLPGGEYRVTFDMDDWGSGHWDGVYVAIVDHAEYTGLDGDDMIVEGGDVTLDNWAFQCNWFALKFSDENFSPEDANFELVYDQGDANPIQILEEYLTNLEWGLSAPDSKIDRTTFDALIARCDATGRTFNGLFTSQANPSEIISQFLYPAHALLVYSENKFKIIEDIFSEPSKTFEEDNTILKSFQFSKKDVGSMISRLKIKFEDSESAYAVRSVLIDDLDLIGLIGIKEASQFLAGVNTETQALEVGTYLFRSLRQPSTVTFKASINDADLESGEMIEIIRPAVQYGDVFRVAEIQEEPNDEIQITGISFFPDNEQIVLTTEDDFREQTLRNVQITRVEDGEVFGEEGGIWLFYLPLYAESSLYEGSLDSETQEIPTLPLAIPGSTFNVDLEMISVPSSFEGATFNVDIPTPTTPLSLFVGSTFEIDLGVIETAVSLFEGETFTSHLFDGGTIYTQVGVYPGYTFEAELILEASPFTYPGLSLATEILWLTAGVTFGIL